MSELPEVTTSLGHTPDGQWAFDDSVAVCFDDMLARSIPQYEVMRRACFDAGKRYVKSKDWIIDLGCSRGEALSDFVSHFGAHNHYLGIEVSAPMANAARERFKGYIDSGIMDIRERDLRTYYPPMDAGLTLSILTLQFTPIEYRQQIIREVYEHTRPGGAFILVEKILGATADLDRLFVNTYYALKEVNGYSREEIDRKRLSLEGVLVPVTARWNEELLQSAGFRQVDCFWRWMNFAGWIAIKER